MAMPAHTEAARRWTPDEVRTLNEASSDTRFECIDGELLVTPAPSYDHQEAGARLWRVLDDYLHRQRLGHAFVAPVEVQLDPRSLVQPDVFVAPLVDGRRPRGHELASRLLLAAEILSPSTARYDRVTKRRYYQRAGTPEYWIVDVDARLIERWRPADERPELLDATLAWHPDGASEPLTLDVARYFSDVMG